VSPADPADPATPARSTPAGPPAPLGELPDPSTRPCADCGHVWFDGERRHEYVIGPPPPGFRNGRVEVVCVLCRRQRRRAAADAADA
jgi:hypothetical protein